MRLSPAIVHSISFGLLVLVGMSSACAPSPLRQYEALHKRALSLDSWGEVQDYRRPTARRFSFDRPVAIHIDLDDAIMEKRGFKTSYLANYEILHIAVTEPAGFTIYAEAPAQGRFVVDFDVWVFREDGIAMPNVFVNSRGLPLRANMPPRFVKEYVGKFKTRGNYFVIVSARNEFPDRALTFLNRHKAIGGPSRFVEQTPYRVTLHASPEGRVDLKFSRALDGIVEAAFAADPTAVTAPLDNVNKELNEDEIDLWRSLWIEFIASSDTRAPLTVPIAVHKLYASMTSDSRAQFVRIPRDVAIYNANGHIGPLIRNAWRMWQGSPLVRNCDTKFPEQCSQKILTLLWDGIWFELSEEARASLACHFDIASKIPIDYSGFHRLSMGEMVDSLIWQVERKLPELKLGDPSCQKNFEIRVSGDVDRDCYVRAEFSQSGAKTAPLPIVLNEIAWRNGFQTVYADEHAVVLEFRQKCAWPQAPEQHQPPG